MVKTGKEMKEKGRDTPWGEGNVLKRDIGMNWDQSIRYTHSCNIGNEVENIGSP